MEAVDEKMNNISRRSTITYMYSQLPNIYNEIKPIIWSKLLKAEPKIKSKHRAVNHGSEHLHEKNYEKERYVYDCRNN